MGLNFAEKAKFLPSGEMSIRLVIKSIKNPRAGTIRRRAASSTLCWSRHQHYVGADQSSLYTDQQSLPGKQTEKRKEWITAHTWQAIKSRRALKKKVMDTRSEGLNERYRQQEGGGGGG